MAARRQLGDSYRGRTNSCLSGRSLAPLRLSGSEFQQQLYSALQTIPYGNTVSYQELAAMSARPKALRAVVNANSRDPIALIVPCHRVIGSDGSLTGFAGGLALKKRLLDLESFKYQYDMDFS